MGAYFFLDSLGDLGQIPYVAIIVPVCRRKIDFFLYRAVANKNVKDFIYEKYQEIIINAYYSEDGLCSRPVLQLSTVPGTTEHIQPLLIVSQQSFPTNPI